MKDTSGKNGARFQLRSLYILAPCGGQVHECREWKTTSWSFWGNYSIPVQVTETSNFGSLAQGRVPCVTRTALDL